MAAATSVQISLDLDPGRAAALHLIADRLPEVAQLKTPVERMERL